MNEPEASMTDVYNKLTDLHETMLSIRNELHLIREATYGSTITEVDSGTRWENPKHGTWGAIGDSSAQIEGVLAEIADNIREIRIKQK